jgi:hypothetical protein
MRALASGQDPSPSFKLYGKTDVSVATDFLNKVVSKCKSVPNWQSSYEASRLEKWGPQGGHRPWDELKDDFMLYYERPSFVNVEAFRDLLDRVDGKYSLLDCTKLPLDGTLAHLVANDKIRERASGWRAFDLKKTDPEAMAMALADASSGFWKHGWGYVFSRYNKLKKRMFFPMPYSDMLLEAQYFAPFLAAIQKDLREKGPLSDFVFWADKIGFEPMYRDIVSPLCRDANPSHLVFVQRDFEKMDTTSGYLQTRTFFYPKLRNALKGVRGNPLEEKALDDLLLFGATCPVLTPDGVYTGYRGKASGAETTNGDETCGNESFNAIFVEILRTLCKQRNIYFNVIGSFGNGDDGLNIFELYHLEDLPAFKICVAKAAEDAGELCGYRVQGSKFTVDLGHGIYCQRMVAPMEGRIWDAYPAVLILNSIVNTEHQYSPSAWDKDYRDLDIIGKLDNGANLQYFHELVDYVDYGMKYRLLGRSEEETRRIVSKWEAWKQLRYEPFNVQNPDYVTDITKSPTLRYLLEKRGHTLG